MSEATLLTSLQEVCMMLGLHLGVRLWEPLFCRHQEVLIALHHCYVSKGFMNFIKIPLIYTADRSADTTLAKAYRNTRTKMSMMYNCIGMKVTLRKGRKRKPSVWQGWRVQHLLCLSCWKSWRRKVISTINMQLSTLYLRYMGEYYMCFHDVLYACNSDSFKILKLKNKV